MIPVPLCRYCGKPLAKQTVIVYAKPEPTEYDHPSRFIRYVYGGPFRNKADCQRAVNELVVSVSYDHRNNLVDRFSTWDGESYIDPYFCNGSHASAFAYAAAKMKPLLAMPAYFDAVKRQKSRLDIDYARTHNIRAAKEIQR